jgi:hypothetical protein
LLARFVGRDARAGEAIAHASIEDRDNAIARLRDASWNMVSRYLSVEKARCAQFDANDDGIRLFEAVTG